MGTKEEIFMCGTKGIFVRSVIAEGIKDGEEVVTVIPHGSKVEILSIIPLYLDVIPPGEKEPFRIKMHEPRRLGEVLQVTYNPSVGKIL
jgi:hypothetical protein